MAVYDARKMLQEMLEADVPLKFDVNWTEDETYNYIIHMYDVFMFKPNWYYAEDTALVVYTIRRKRNQRWTTPFKPGARS